MRRQQLIDRVLGMTADAIRAACWIRLWRDDGACCDVPVTGVEFVGEPVALFSTMEYPGVILEADVPAGMAGWTFPVQVGNINVLLADELPVIHEVIRPAMTVVADDELRYTLWRAPRPGVQ